MNEKQGVTNQSAVHGSQRIQAIVVKNIRAIYQPLSAFEKIKAQFLRRGLNVYRTPHFLVACAPSDAIITLVHCFSVEEIDNNVVYYLIQELALHELITSEQAFGAALVSIVTSILPSDPVTAWGHFSLNTLRRLQGYVDANSMIGSGDFISSFASIYRRLFALKVGSSLLDVGCACAFWPVLAAQRFKDKQAKIVGVDNRLDAIHLSTHLAELAQVNSVEFVLTDALTTQFLQLGRFDTVTAIHLLEHFSEEKLPYVFDQLLRVTRHRLIVAVPYEAKPEQAYGHKQVWSHEKLVAWGQWCMDRLYDHGTAHCEDVQGGLLIIDRV